jgi:glycosyltransferase involved in cell wall biosynthesis
VDFSIIICTYNPKEKILQRLFNAIKKFESNKLNFEVILVDNNSKVRLNTERYVSDFLKETCAKLIIEEKPGLTSARIAGIKEAKGKWLVFFDDDNEPAHDYLVKAKHEIIQFPDVIAWGPSQIKVEFMGTTNPWFLKNEHLFQAKDINQTQFANDSHWQSCYPFGTGLIIRKDIAKLYAIRVLENRYTLTDRKGKSLASGGDVQLVMTGIEQGFLAGVIGGLKINHIIDQKKTQLPYILKMEYGTASAYVKAYNQVFQKRPIQIKEISNWDVILKVYSLFRIHRNKMCQRDFRIFFASKMGELNAVCEVTIKKPLVLRVYEKLIGV